MGGRSFAAPRGGLVARLSDGTDSADARFVGEPRRGIRTRTLAGVVTGLLTASILVGGGASSVIVPVGAPGSGDARSASPDAGSDAAEVAGAESLAAGVHPLTGAPGDYDVLLDAIGDARFVLIGDASHGTREFYEERAEITRRLIVERGFDAVALEAAWTDVERVDRYAAGEGTDADADAALRDFGGFPAWMWRNASVRDFVEWLGDHNAGVAPSERAGVYGLDVYSLSESIEAVVSYLDETDAEGAARARDRYACFGNRADPIEYGRAAARDETERCTDAAQAQLDELDRALADRQRWRSATDRAAAEDAFAAEHNARVVRNAERYYRSLFSGDEPSWNIRDRHMAETLEELTAFLSQQGREARVVVWAHNTHAGDARATQMSQGGQISLGQLVRQRHPDGTVTIGFTTYDGTVMAASDWEGPHEVKTVQQAAEGSYEDLFHAVALLGGPDFLITLSADPANEVLNTERLERAIGVVYRPESELFSHYFRARLTDQFDVVVHLDRTTAVELLDPLPDGRGEP